MTPSDEKQTPIQCKLTPVLLALNWAILLGLSAKVLINPWGSFFDVVFMYFVCVAVLYNSINYEIGADGIALKILFWSYPLRWEDMTRVEVSRFFTAIYVSDINIWVRLLGAVGGIAFFTGPQFRVYQFHSNYSVMVDTLQQHVKKFTRRE